MSQHALTITNQAGASFRSDLINAIQALGSNNSGAAAPATTYAFQLWADTTNDLLKIRNAANSAWISVATLSTGLPIGRAAAGANADITSLSALTRAPWSPGQNDFRLTLTTAVPVATADVTGATTIYCTPYKGKSIALYDGTNWNIRQSAQFSLALGTLTSGKPYDVFCTDVATVPTLGVLAWTDDANRATALAYQDGVLVRSGTPTQRYLGTFYTTSTTTTEDSAANRYLWNYYHRAERPMSKYDNTSTWNQATGAWRQMNAAGSNQVNFIVGVAEDAVIFGASGSGINSTATQRNYAVGVGFNTVSAPQILKGSSVSNASAVALTAWGAYMPAAGKYYAAACEYQGADTATWAGGSNYNTGVFGSIKG